MKFRIQLKRQFICGCIQKLLLTCYQGLQIWDNGFKTSGVVAIHHDLEFQSFTQITDLFQLLHIDQGHIAASLRTGFQCVFSC